MVKNLYHSIHANDIHLLSLRLAYCTQSSACLPDGPSFRQILTELSFQIIGFDLYNSEDIHIIKVA